MKCYQCLKEFKPKNGFVEILRQYGGVFERYICSDCKEELEKKLDKSGILKQDLPQIGFFKGVAALFIANITTVILFFVAVMATNEYSFIFAIGFGFIVGWIFMGLVKGVNRLWQIIFIVFSAISYIYGIVLTYLYMFAIEMSMTFFEYLKYLAVNWHFSIKMVVVDMPKHIVTEPFLLITIVLLLLTLFGGTQGWSKSIAKRKFRPLKADVKESVKESLKS